MLELEHKLPSVAGIQQVDVSDIIVIRSLQADGDRDKKKRSSLFSAILSIDIPGGSVDDLEGHLRAHCGVYYGGLLLRIAAVL